MRFQVIRLCLVTTCCTVLLSCGDDRSDSEEASNPADQELAQSTTTEPPVPTPSPSVVTVDDLEGATLEESASFFGIELPTAPATEVADTDSATRQAELAAYEHQLEEALKRVEQAKAELAQARAEIEAKRGLVPESEVPVFVPPTDHLEPFEASFGFGNPEEVDHFWNWGQHWEFTDAHAVNTQRSGGAVLHSTYKLVGDFEITVKGTLSKSWTNSRRSQFEVCGQVIVLANWRSTGIDLSVRRQGNQLTYTHNGGAPVVVELNEEQAGPARARLVAYGRHATIREFSFRADSADRISE